MPSYVAIDMKQKIHRTSFLKAILLEAKKSWMSFIKKKGYVIMLSLNVVTFKVKKYF